MHNKPIYPIVLTILDGWGYSKNNKGNAIQIANTPTMDLLWKKYPNTLLNASGKDVGLPDKQMGNSEVGHTTIGAGRIIDQDLVKIEKAIEDKSFFSNQVINKICNITEEKNTKLHVIGLCSNGGVHSHVDHLEALIKIIQQYNCKTCIHIITDGRDTEAKEAKKFINKIKQVIACTNNCNICTLSGRYYSMDRDCRWSRTEKAYNILINSQISEGFHNMDPNAVIEEYYQNDISDEFIPPTRIREGHIEDGDGIIFFNFRPDRSRQLLHSLAKSKFRGFKARYIKDLEFATFTEYDSSLKIPIAFPSEKKQSFLGEIISKNGLKQLRLAETEKYAHVTYFFNGGVEEPFPGEDRELIASPKVETYDLSPEMSAYQLTKSISKAIKKNIYQLIIVNYANPDMVGHTGNLQATVKAIEITDECLGHLFNCVKAANGTLIITADHGNAEYMLNEKNEPCKSHSINPVPFILVESNKLYSNNLKSNGCLADIAPTILDILKINIPKDMKGKSLISKKTANL
uniref:2,3-bisphosphoglycerate-independent phosphoglycerate mutase n=1 Tax=Spyridia filamentosa TaxID=196632 RepID=A0A1Z1MK62_SPYFI|nr:phosphoglycerate mutase [Spyridia filamentosa]ARW66151.1 phosphoglycerate mutase [Spyridia filamentosa]